MTTSFTIVGLGEMLWDVFPDGPRFGGAPANFACHAAGLGGNASMVSAVGADELGDEALRTLTGKRVGTEHVTRLSDYPTGTVQVQIDAAGQPQYTFSEDVAWDHLDWTGAMAGLAARADAVCWGTLAQRSQTSQETIERFVAATSPHALRVFDINLRPPYVNDAAIDASLELATVLKLNDDELEVLTKRYDLSGSAADRAGQLVDKFGLRLVALSRGAAGAILREGDRVSESPGMEVDVKDTVGAGDAFAASLTLGLLRGSDLDAINQHACRVAAFVCTQSGATPTLPAELGGVDASS